MGKIIHLLKTSQVCYLITSIAPRIGENLTASHLNGSGSGHCRLVSAGLCRIRF